MRQAGPYCGTEGNISRIHRIISVEVYYERRNHAMAAFMDSCRKALSDMQSLSLAIRMSASGQPETRRCSMFPGRVKTVCLSNMYLTAGSQPADVIVTGATTIHIKSV